MNHEEALQAAAQIIDEYAGQVATLLRQGRADFVLPHPVTIADRCNRAYLEARADEDCDGECNCKDWGHHCRRSMADTLLSDFGEVGA